MKDCYDCGVREAKKEMKTGISRKSKYKKGTDEYNESLRGYKSVMKNEEIEIDEGMMDTVKKVGGKVLKTLGHGSDADMIKDLAKKTGVNPPPKPKKEAVDRNQATTDTLAGRIKGGKDNEHSSIKVKLKAEATEKHDDKPPFDGPYTKVKGTVKDKSGAIHTPMSRAKHLARQAMKKVKSEMMIGKAGGTSE